MTIVDLAQIVGALGFIPGLLWIGRRLMRDPKGQAETRKLNIEADGMIVDRLYAEIERLDREMTELRGQFSEAKETAAAALVLEQKENKRLKAEIMLLRLRVDGLERIIRMGPKTDEETAALLAALDRQIAQRKS